MADLDRTRADAKGQLFDHLGDVRAGMLGVEGSGQHMQPMTHYHDREAGEVWFITSRDTDLVKAVGQGATAHYCLIGEKQDFYACMSGPILQVDDPHKLDEIWSFVASAWFDKGRADPEVTLLKVTLASAAIWATDGNPVVFGIEIARSAMQEGHTPNVGEHVIVDFRTAA